ncbi:hypothetical protein [Amphibacillus xylanus]|uniref:Uncharacterized protein n=1 Tax=Amphibacillus xylanus (strain ATCC 51415 / DSM 6626 / JCM 7361 / LMG 17667 / NBRC 15112 / Ep01) TaxID=698758 RepID=K0J2G7_AMPXN|nr:hypothetical protein [Amphibacillus xylanus]BAM46691.1 hypothetical protein AXY_05590 [Amphibacillus xylanus NBRC 15112]
MKNDYSPKNNGRKKGSEFKGYLDKNGFAVGYEYEAIIELKGDWTTKETIAFVSQSFDTDSIIEVDGPKVKILWKMPEWGDVEDLGILLYYLLDDGELGSYDYYRIN